MLCAMGRFVLSSSVLSIGHGGFLCVQPKLCVVLEFYSSMEQFHHEVCLTTYL